MTNSSPEKRPMTPEDLYALEQIQGFDISPDGQKVVYAVQWVEKETEKKYSNLWLVDTATGESTRFTQGKQTDANPKWSPDGQSIAFLSNRADTTLPPALYVIPIAGGEARTVGELKGMILDYEWAPDSSRFVLSFIKPDPHVIEWMENPKKKELGLVERHITRAYFRTEGLGYRGQENAHLWTLDVDSGEANQITDGDFYEMEPTWSPDGSQIIFSSVRHEDWDIVNYSSDFYIIPAEGGEFRKLDTAGYDIYGPSFSPDGKWIAYRGRLEKNAWFLNSRMFIAPVNGEGESRCVTADLNISFSSDTMGDFGSPPNQNKLIWSNDGQSLYSTYSRHGKSPFSKVSIEDGTMTDIIDDEKVVGMVAFDATQETLAYFRANEVDPTQLWIRTESTGESKPITDINRELLDQIDFGAIKEVWYKGNDDNDLQGWIMTPPGFDPSQTYPAVIYIHGGPLTQYGRSFFHEFYTLAAEGFVVAYTNPRGGTGYGEEHAGAIRGVWGTVDYDDMMSFTDLLVEEPYIDGDRLGVCGGSYGGYLTGMIVGKTHRFKAAVAQRMVSNLVSFHGTSDFNWGVKYLVGLETEPWNDLENYWKQSPMSLVGNVETPTMVIHSEGDLRCAVEQGEQYFVALRLRGVDTELVLYPGENHGLSRGGRTDRRISRMNRNSGWFKRYLQPTESSE